MSDFAEVRLSIAELKEAMRTDCVTFLSFYIEEELTLEVPQLHEEIWDEFVHMLHLTTLPEWVDHLQKLFCVPRGHAKSTLTKLAIILFMRYSPLNFALYASLTSNIAKNAVKDVVAWLTSEKDAMLWGKAVLHKSNDTEQLWILTIGVPVSPWNRQAGPDGNARKRIILKALGADQQVRGTLIENQRPQLLIIDDCEDNDTAKDADTQMKLDTWLMGNLMKATARRSVRIMLGNMINSRTALYRLSKDKDWSPTVYGAIIRDKKTGQLVPLWPGMHTVASLMAEYRKYQQMGLGHVWLYEMMNMTNDSIMKSSMALAQRMPRPNPDQVVSGIIILDPAFGQDNIHDESALTVHVKLKGNPIPWMVESRKGRWTEERLVDEFIELSYYWNLTTWGIESVAAQRLLLKIFATILKDRQQPVDLFTMVPLMSGGTAKASRINAWIGSVAAGSYGIVDEEQELVEILEKYDPLEEKHDDVADSGAYGLIAWSMEGIQIKEALNIKTALAIMQQQTKTESVHQSKYVPY